MVLIRSKMPTIAHKRRVLEEADERVDDARNDDPQRLRQDDENHHLPVVQAERHRSLVLPLRHGLQPAAHHLGHIGGGEEGNAHQGPREPVDGHVARQEERQHGVRHDQDGDQRHAAHEFDEDRPTPASEPAASSAARGPGERRRAAKRRCRRSRQGGLRGCRPKGMSEPPQGRTRTHP